MPPNNYKIILVLIFIVSTILSCDQKIEKCWLLKRMISDVKIYGDNKSSYELKRIAVNQHTRGELMLICFDKDSIRWSNGDVHKYSLSSDLVVIEREFNDEYPVRFTGDKIIMDYSKSGWTPNDFMVYEYEALTTYAQAINQSKMIDLLMKNDWVYGKKREEVVLKFRINEDAHSVVYSPKDTSNWNHFILGDELFLSIDKKDQIQVKKVTANLIEGILLSSEEQEAILFTKK